MLTADRRVEEEDTRGRIRYRWHEVRKENHDKDCEKMIKVAAIVTKTIASRVVPLESEAGLVMTPMAE